jgi:nitroreductase
MECGHCIAICPTNAAYLDDYDMSEVVEGSLFQTALDADALMRAIKGRRSVRQYTKQPVEPKKIHDILEAARFTPTAGNRQSVSYAVVEKYLPELKIIAMDSLLELGKKDLNNPDISPMMALYAKRFLEMHKKYHESNGQIDLLFFNAPVVIVAMSDRPVDAGMAASNMELMAYAQGLGALFVGFLVRAASNSQAVRDFLGVPEGQQVLLSMGVGYPNVDYLRSVPRRKAKVNYL